ncbi:MAG: DUF4124 domain-containing protein [Candidatus Nitricoxidivorans perseverans]|uniref:DUF4124 domain-containing protein n=1 Tax=Candidatus Nitricoxidivorans perseverans TaxID=2975601 RepID=A0AA49IY64_9PROT|nr:MAG: DUF4124 domain-containing protein [Candidatus Nitricoxidivorans perseverans]
MNRRHFPLLLALIAGVAQADTLYKCTDSQGHTTYTNQKTVGTSCIVLSQDKPVSTFSAPSRPTRAATPTPGGFPRVGDGQQKARDNDRRGILEEELSTEQKKLDAARKALSEQEAVRLGDERNYQRVLDRLKPYQETVQLHERNVEALRKELANLK